MAKSSKTKFFHKHSIKRIILAGCGGTGSILAEHLCRMIAGFKLECSLVLYDGDKIEEANITRQNFEVYEIGQNKAQALALRLSGKFGIEVGFINKFMNRQDSYMGELLITATDNLESRKIAAQAKCDIWIDVGNELSHGQAIIGTTHCRRDLRGMYKDFEADSAVFCLPDAAALNPAILKSRKQAKKASCATVPFGEQGFGVNAMAALATATLAKQAIVDRKVRFAAIYFDVAKARMIPRLIDRELFKPWSKNGK